MSRVLLLSILVAMVVVPARAALDPRPGRAARRVELVFLGLCAIWAQLVLHLFTLLKD